MKKISTNDMIDKIVSLIEKKVENLKLESQSK